MNVITKQEEVMPIPKWRLKEYSDGKMLYIEALNMVNNWNRIASFTSDSPWRYWVQPGDD